MTSEYSYYSDDAYHEKELVKNEHPEKVIINFNAQKSGMTEQNVVPKDLPAIIDNTQDKMIEVDTESDWSDQLREANQKSGFTNAKVQE